jgi:pyruvate/2-oxoglutarate dehydrogenase complex dihydrolipoamide acyltransferase (E2) component
VKIKVVMPKWGTGMNEGKILRWLKAVGDTVTEGEPLAEIETAKAVQELEAPVSGLLTDILLEQGGEAEVRTPIAIIDAELKSSNAL